jgi:cobalamin synthase
MDWQTLRLTQALKETLAFLTVLPGRIERPDLLGQSFWWAVPALEAIRIGLVAAICLAANRILGLAGISAALFIILDQASHGLRRVDGLSDAGEGIFYRLANPGASPDEVWSVVRSPANGPFGTALIVLYLLLQWLLIQNLLSLGSVPFYVGVILAAVMSKLAVAIAVAAPGQFHPASRFQPLAREVARPARLILLGLVVCAIGGAVGQDVLLTGITAVMAAAAGWATRFVAVSALGRLNGDLIGLSWCISEAIILWIVNVRLTWAI